MLLLSAASCCSPPTPWGDVTGYCFGDRLVSNRSKTKCGHPKIKSQAQASPAIGSRGEEDELSVEKEAENETWRIRLAGPAAGGEV